MFHSVNWFGNSFFFFNKHFFLFVLSLHTNHSILIPLSWFDCHDRSKEGCVKSFASVSIPPHVPVMEPMTSLCSVQFLCGYVCTCVCVYTNEGFGLCYCFNVLWPTTCQLMVEVLSEYLFLAGVCELSWIMMNKIRYYRPLFDPVSWP